MSTLSSWDPDACPGGWGDSSLSFKSLLTIESKAITNSPPGLYSDTVQVMTA